MRLVVLATLLVPSTVWAHVQLTFPAPRTTDQKAKHCGAAGSVRGTNVTTFKPGEVITVRWNETIDHPGHYRISFDDDGQDFIQPPTATDSTEGMPNVVKDLIPDLGGPLPAGGRPYEFQITLPNIECSNCTLQLIQMMTDKPPYATTGPDDNDIYYQCADITLSNTAPMPDAGGGGGGGDGDGDAGVGGGGNNNGGGDIGGGCSTGGASGAATGLPLLLGFVPLLRRRRRR